MSACGNPSEWSRKLSRALAILVIAVPLGSFVHSGSATAQIGYDINVCYQRSKEITAPRADAPALVNETLQRFPMLAFRVCSDRWGEHYYLRTPEPVANGVCMFREREVFPAVDPNAGSTQPLAGNAPGFSPTYEKPPYPWGTNGLERDYQFMAVQQTACPPLEAQRYAAVYDIAAAEFMRLRDAWLSLARSEDAFDSVVSNLPQSCDRIMAGFPPTIQKRMYDKLVASFHSFLFDPATSLNVSLIKKVGDAYDVHVTSVRDPWFALRIGDVSGTLRITCLEGLYVQ